MTGADQAGSYHHSPRRCDNGCGMKASLGVRPRLQTRGSLRPLPQPHWLLICLPHETLYPSSLVLLAAPHPLSCGSDVFPTANLP